MENLYASDVADKLIKEFNVRIILFRQVISTACQRALGSNATLLEWSLQRT